jgi:hypothetical protein
MSHAAWGHVLRVAAANGWQPQGTQPKRAMISLQLESTYPGDQDLEGATERVAEQWKGSYLHNEWQIVVSDDAAGLAAALERALESSSDALLRIKPSRRLADKMLELRAHLRETMFTGHGQGNDDRFEIRFEQPRRQLTSERIRDLMI